MAEFFKKSNMGMEMIILYILAGVAAYFLIMGIIKALNVGS